MAKVTGLGGVFLRSRDPEALYLWYEKNLGLVRESGSWLFAAAGQRGPIATSLFSQASDYFPVAQPAMLNFQVDDLDALLDKLAADGVSVAPQRDSYEFGKFGWFFDPERNKVELWQPSGE